MGECLSPVGFLPQNVQETPMPKLTLVEGLKDCAAHPPSGGACGHMFSPLLTSPFCIFVLHVFERWRYMNVAVQM
ncbi:hypothetical protein LINPERPRIM_LOCUS12902, partial [Linum perenne]